ncbi:MAG: hypothetical protein Q6370_025735 [Candidatus Sigynarchaeota archaeon]
MIVSHRDPSLAPPGKQFLFAGVRLDPALAREKDILVQILLEKLQKLTPTDSS